MPVPSLISDLSQTPGSNFPLGSESPITTDDYFRTYAAFIAQLRDGKGYSVESSLASASTTDIGAQNSFFVQITGTTTITSFGTNYNGPRYVRFAGVLTLTHNASTLILPGGANITTAAGDAVIAVPVGSPGSGWRVMSFIAASTAEAQAGTDVTKYLTPATMKAAQIQQGTAVTLTNQTTVDFTSIPSWVKRIVVTASAISTNGTTAYLIQLGDSGGFETSGYSGSAGSVLFSAGFIFANPGLAAAVSHAVVTITKVTGNTWIAQGGLAQSTTAAQALTSGSKTLSATLDRLRITTDNGTDQFDAGVINILWE